jgi:MoaA/NifB/PqqE/SkfB family radical SAM enzyme
MSGESLRGEPLQFPQMARLIREFGDSETIINIVTNGTIMTSDLVDALSSAPSLRLQISTHGLDGVEDVIKAHRGAAAKVERTLGLLQDAGVDVSLATVVQKSNLHRLLDIYRHFSTVPATHHSFVMYEPMGDGRPEHIDPDAVRDQRLRTAEARAAYLQEALQTVELSTSWRVTAPLRRLARAVRQRDRRAPSTERPGPASR